MAVDEPRGSYDVHVEGSSGVQVGDGNTQTNNFQAAGRTDSDDGAARTSGREKTWRVFVSHTGELASYPAGGSFVAAAKRAIERAGHVAVEMDTWTASPRPPAQLCAERLGGCDVYVGVLGFRYGSPVREDPARSYTELEFDIAGETGMPRLVFLLAEQLNADVPQSFYQDAEYGKRQEMFRARVDGSGLTRAKVASPGDLELLLFQGLTELAGQPGPAAGGQAR